MSRVDHWRIYKICNSNRMKSGTLANVKCHYRKVSHRSNRSYTNNARKMIGETTKRYVHLVRVLIQHRKKILNDMEVKNHEN